MVYAHHVITYIKKTYSIIIRIKSFPGIRSHLLKILILKLQYDCSENNLFQIVNFEPKILFLKLPQFVYLVFCLH